MRLLFLIFLLSFSSLALSKPKVIVLSSIRDSNLFNPKRKIRKKIEKYFKNNLENQDKFELVFKHKVDQHEANQVLNQDGVLAIFWIGHGAEASLGDGNISHPGVLLDYNEHNMLEIFQEINPNTKLLSVIGCESSKTFEQMGIDGYHLYNTFLTVHSFEQKVELKEGILAAVERANKEIPQMLTYPKISKPSQVQTYDLLVKRSMDGKDKGKSLRLLLNGKMLSTFSKLSKDDSNETVVKIPAHLIKPGKKNKLIFKNGSVFENDDNLGRIDISPINFSATIKKFQVNGKSTISGKQIHYLKLN